MNSIELRRGTTVVGVLFFTFAGAVALEQRESASSTSSDKAPAVRLVSIGPGWARSSVNAVIFRQHSLATVGNRQVAAYYDADARMVLARRSLGQTAWDTSATQYRGNVRDAHNAISLTFDGRGVLHVAWDHHGQPLNYARGAAPGSLRLTARQPMTGERENRVTYPQFVNLPNGDLLVAYRDGESGAGDVLLNRFDVEGGRWTVDRRQSSAHLGRGPTQRLLERIRGRSARTLARLLVLARDE
ncbi:MAG: BNR-4 repeat-containing protein [Vicinamibacteraceae bacterium]